MSAMISKLDNSLGTRSPEDILKSEGDEADIRPAENGLLIQKRTIQPEKLKAVGMLKEHLKRHVSDDEMENAWMHSVEKEWDGSMEKSVHITKEA